MYRSVPAIVTSETGSPTTIEGNVIDSWRGHAAISGALRGPYLVLDNAFTNGSSGVAVHDPYCQPDDFTCGNPMGFQPWAMTNAWALLSGNTPLRRGQWNKTEYFVYDRRTLLRFKLKPKDNRGMQLD